MEELAWYRQEILSKLEGVVETLSKTVAGVPPNAWHTAKDTGAATPHSLLAHLQQLEAQWFAVQLHRIVEEEKPLLPLFEDKAWMGNQYDPGVPAQVLLKEFASLRKQEVTWLRGLPLESWSCTARHPWKGVRTLQWWVELQLEYSQQHLKDLAACIPE